MANLSNINNKFLVTTGGDVGVGVTSPGSKLSIGGTTGSYTSGIGFQPTGTGARIYRTFIGTDGSFRFDDVTAGFATRLTINSSGDTFIKKNLQIGEASNTTSASNNYIPIKINTTYSTTASPQWSLQGWVATTDGADPFAMTSGETTKNVYMGIIGAQYMNQNRFSIIQGGVERLTVNLTQTGGGGASGNVGIGTTLPGAKLDIGTSSGTSMQFLYDTSQSYRNTISNYWNSSTDSRMDFSIGNTANVAPTTIMSVGYGSNVGIGTITPGAKLDVVGPSSGSAILKLQRNGVGAYQYFVTDIGSGAQQLFCDAQQADSGFVFRTRDSSNATVTALFLAPSGNVGIGTASPGEKLDTPNIVIGGASISGTYRANSLLIDNTGGNSRFYSTGVNASTRGGYTFHVTASDGNPNDVALTIANTGNVGIGTTIINDPFTSTAALQIGNINLASDNSLLTMGSGNQGSGDIYFADSTSGGGQYSGWLSYKHLNDYMTIGTAGTERIRITGGGGAGEGSTMINYANTAIQTYGSGAYSAKLIVKAHTTTPNAAITCLNGNIGGDNPVQLNFVNEFVANQYNYIARIIAAPESNWGGTASTRNSSLNFHTNSAGSDSEKMRITSAGDVLINRVARANGYDSGFKTLTVASNLDQKASILELIGTRSEGGNQNGMISFFNDRITLTETSQIAGLTASGTNGYLGGEIAFNTKPVSGTINTKLLISADGTLTSSSIAGSYGIRQNGVSNISNSGYVAGNGTLSFTYDALSQGSMFIECVMNHYGLIAGYGCSRIATVAIGPNIQVQDIQNITSTNGGSWTFTRVSNSQFTIAKTAGTYGGGGYYFINIRGTGVKYT